MVNNLINLAKEREKRVVQIIINGDDIDFEGLKEFLESQEPDDYEMRIDALSLAIETVSVDSYYYGSHTILEIAKDYYKFLKAG